jgi:ribulose-phosphate 3-epimerase
LAKRIRLSGSKAAIALKPGTSIDVILDNLNEFDMVLIMTVEPGFGGQTFMAEMMPKVIKARAEVTRLGLDIRIQVDGGIDAETIIQASAAGADTFVAGSAIFCESERNRKIQLLRDIANKHLRA